MKFSLYSSILILFLASCQSATEKNDKSSLPWFKFHWVGSEIEGKYYDKFSIYLPVSLNNIQQETYVQLDLGSSVSMLYEETLNEMLRLGQIQSFTKDSLSLDSINRQEYYLSKDLTLTLNAQTINPEGLFIRKNYGDKYLPASKKITDKSIGTLGVDFFKNKTLVIDYPSEQICVIDTIPAALDSSVQWQSCGFNGGSPLISLNIGGVNRNFIFDTGSSLFALLTTTSIFNAITDNTSYDTLNVPSWGNILTVVGRPIKEEVKFGNLVLPKERAYFFLRSEIEAQFKSAGIDGLTGNKLFLKNTVFIDFKNSRFGL